MSRTLSLTFRQALFSRETEEVPVVLLTITHASLVEPIRISLEQERKVTESISELASIAREEGDHVSEQFVQWFLKEQVEEVALFSSLLAVAERARDRPMDIEQYIAREGVGAEDPDPTAPPAAGA